MRNDVGNRDDLGRHSVETEEMLCPREEQVVSKDTGITPGQESCQ